MSEIEFGDIEPEDVVTEGDEEVNWDNVEQLDSQIKTIQEIEDNEERLVAAKTWAGELEG